MQDQTGSTQDESKLRAGLGEFLKTAPPEPDKPPIKP
jgi:hypothetical protein